MLFRMVILVFWKELEKMEEETLLYLARIESHNLVQERNLKEYSWAGESVGSSQLFMISSGVSILDNNESDNSKDRLLGTQSELELGQSSDFYYRKIRQSGWDLYSQWLCSP